MITITGEKIFTAKIDKGGNINKTFKGHEGQEVYVVIPSEEESKISASIKDLLLLLKDKDITEEEKEMIEMRIETLRDVKEI